MGLGVEYTSHRHDFATVAAGEAGDVHTQILQFIVRKYFFAKSAVRPFLGLGIGGAHTRAEYQSGGIDREDDTGSLVLQGVVGTEFQIDNLSLMLEIKRFWHEPGSSGDFNATATGVFGGLGFSW
jgi:outer membrane protein W